LCPSRVCQFIGAHSVHHFSWPTVFDGGRYSGKGKDAVVLQSVQWSVRDLHLCGWEDNRRSGVHWSCVTDSVIYPPTGSMTWEREMNTLPIRFMARHIHIHIHIKFKTRAKNSKREQWKTHSSLWYVQGCISSRFSTTLLSLTIIKVIPYKRR